MICRLFDLGIQNGHGIIPSAPNKNPVLCSLDNVGGGGGDGSEIEGGVDRRDNVEDCCVNGVESDQNGHGLPT